MVLSLRVTLPAMADEFEELDELEAAIKKWDTTMEQYAFTMSASMDRVITKMELLNSKFNAIVESDEKRRFMASVEQSEHHQDASHLDQIEALIAARNQYETSRLDRIEATIAAMMRQCGLEDEHISSLTTRDMRLNSTVDLPIPSPSSTICVVEPTYVIADDCAIMESIESVKSSTSIELVSEQSVQSDDFPFVNFAALPLCKSLVEEIVIDDYTITHSADFETEFSNVDSLETPMNRMKCVPSGQENKSFIKLASQVAILMEEVLDATLIDGLTLTGVFDPGIGYYTQATLQSDVLNGFHQNSLSEVKCKITTPWLTVLSCVGAYFSARGTTRVSSAQHSSLFNITNNGNLNNHAFGLELDVLKSQQINDIHNYNHVGVDINLFNSLCLHAVGSWTVYGSLDEVYMEFCGATGQVVESHKILSWSFSNADSSIGDALVIANLPSSLFPKGSVIRSKGFTVGVNMGVLFISGSASVIFACFLIWKTNKRDEEDTEYRELKYWPDQIWYEDIYVAIKESPYPKVIGFGGNGKIYRRVLQDVKVAEKQIPYDSDEKGTRELLSGNSMTNSSVKQAGKMVAVYVDLVDFSDHQVVEAKNIERIRTKLGQLEIKFGLKPIVVMEKDYDRDSRILKRLDPFKIFLLCFKLKGVICCNSSEESSKKFRRDQLQIKFPATNQTVYLILDMPLLGYALRLTFFFWHFIPSEYFEDHSCDHTQHPLTSNWIEDYELAINAAKTLYHPRTHGIIATEATRYNGISFNLLMTATAHFSFAHGTGLPYILICWSLYLVFVKIQGVLEFVLRQFLPCNVDGLLGHGHIIVMNYPTYGIPYFPLNGGPHFVNVLWGIQKDFSCRIVHVIFTMGAIVTSGTFHGGVKSCISNHDYVSWNDFDPLTWLILIWSMMKRGYLRIIYVFCSGFRVYVFCMMKNEFRMYLDVTTQFSQLFFVSRCPSFQLVKNALAHFVDQWLKHTFLDLEDKVHFNGGANVMISKEVGPENDPKREPKSHTHVQPKEEMKNMNILRFGGSIIWTKLVMEGV